MSNEQLQVPIEDVLDALFGQYVVAGQAKGLCYGLVGPAGLVHAAGFGVGDDAGTPVDADTVFPIASMSKSFVAAAALLARDRGLFDLEAPLTRYVPEFHAVWADGAAGAAGPAGAAAPAPTVRQLLSMAGGLTEDNAWVDPFIDLPVADLLATVARGVTYSSPPGVVFEYSNLGYALAGIALGRAVGRPVETFVRAELVEPLGLASTWFDNAAPAAGYRRATGYALDADGRWVGYPPARSAAFAAAGGIQSTVRDLARWVSWLGAAFRPAAADTPAGPLSPASRREMQRLQQISLPALVTRADGAWKLTVGGYGLGLTVTEDLQRGTVVAHSGGLPGFLLHMTWHPTTGHGIVVLTNSHRGNPIELGEQALFRVLDHAQAPARTVRLWPATVELRRRAERLIRSWDDDLAAEILAPNVDFDRPLAARRADIAALLERVGPLRPPRPLADVACAATPAEVTWTIPGERGDLLCMIHLTPVDPPLIQELEVQAAPFDRPAGARPSDVSPRRRALALGALSSLPNTRVELPEA